MARPWRFALLALGAAAFSVSLTLTFEGMRDVLQHNGGFCASGGPYVIAQHCSAGAARALTIGMLGLFLGGGVFVAASAATGAGALGAGLLAWSALFGTLGFNFLDVRGASRVSGAVFELMALGGLTGVVAMAVSWLRRGGRPEPPVFSDDGIVRAAVGPASPVTGAGWGSRR